MVEQAVIASEAGYCVKLAIPSCGVVVAFKFECRSYREVEMVSRKGTPSVASLNAKVLVTVCLDVHTLCTGKEIVKFTLVVSASAKNAAADLKSTYLYLHVDSWSPDSYQSPDLWQAYSMRPFFALV